MLAALATGFVLGLPIALVLGLATMVMPQWFTDFVLVPLVGIALVGVPVYAVIGAVREVWAALRPPPLTRLPDPSYPPPARRLRLGEPG